MKLHALALALTFAVTNALAQVAPAPRVPDETQPASKAPPAKPASPKKAPAPKKAAAPKKADAPKIPVARKAPPPAASGNQSVRVYKAGDPNAPTLRDKDGKVIPTAPGAYDVSSARK